MKSTRLELICKPTLFSMELISCRCLIASSFSWCGLLDGALQVLKYSKLKLNNYYYLLFKLIWNVVTKITCLTLVCVQSDIRKVPKWAGGWRNDCSGVWRKYTIILENSSLITISMSDWWRVSESKGKVIFILKITIIALTGTAFYLLWILSRITNCLLTCFVLQTELMICLW